MSDTLPAPPHSLSALGFSPSRDVLDNGLVVLHQQNPVSASVTISLRLPAGAVFESAETAGLAEFCGTMLERGTGRRGKREIGEVLDFAGARLSTGAGRHTGSLSCKARAADLDELLELVAECAREPSFPAEEVEKVRGDMLTGLREDLDDTRQMAMDAFRHLVYPQGHPYSWKVDGTEESVAAVSRDDLVAFHAARYGPAGAVLVVVGGVERDAVLRGVNEHLGGWSGDSGGGGAAGRQTDARQTGAQRAGAHPAEVHPTVGLAAAMPHIADAPLPEKTVRAVHTMAAKAQADIVLGHPIMRRSDPDYYAATVMNTVLGRFAMGGRLGRSVREEQGMAYYTYSSLDATVGPGPFVVRAGVHPANVDRAIDSIVAEIERLQGGPVGDQELADAVSSLVRSLPRMLESNEGMARALHLIEQHDLGLDYLDRYPGLIGGVDAAEVQRVAAGRLHPERCGIAIAGPYPLDEGASDGRA